MRNLQFLTWFIGLILCGLIFLLINSLFQKIAERKEPVGFCGVSDLPKRHFLDTLPKADFTIGKKLFRENCASCHNKDMKSDMTGPALGGTIKLWKNDTSELLLYIKDSPKYLSHSSNQRILQLHENFGEIVSHKFDLSIDELKAIISYIEMKI